MSNRETPCASDEACRPRSGQGVLRVLGSLPKDPTLISVYRLGLTAALFACAFVVGLALTFVLSALGEPSPQPLGTVVLTASAAISLLVFALVNRRKLRPRNLIRIGVCYEILIALALSLRESSQIGAYGTLVWGISWVCVLIVLFPFLVPTSARRTFFVALAAASMGPLAYAILLGLGEASVAPISRLLRLYLPNYIAAGLAIVPAMVISRLGRDVKKAQELGSYRILECLGRGGMGEVWRAEHRMLARPAAVKLVRPEYLGGECSDNCLSMFRRFEREAQATASLRSPHTIQLYDFGITSDYIFYYVMELLDGFDLEAEIKRFGPLRPERTIYFLCQVCHSLGEAHEIGLIHRDIKPANVYLCRYGREVDFIKVLDFGLVTWERRADEQDLTQTSDDISPGTPAFMAPEQILGDRPLDARTDIYAVGCLAYWLLTANLVFEADTPLAMMMHHVKSTPVPPSKRTEQRIPEALEAVVLSCLEKDPALRPQTVDELSERLTQASSDPWTSERAHQWWEINSPRPSVPTLSRG